MNGSYQAAGVGLDLLLAIASLPSRTSTSAATALAKGVAFMHVLPRLRFIANSLPSNILVAL